MTKYIIILYTYYVMKTIKELVAEIRAKGYQRIDILSRLRITNETLYRWERTNKTKPSFRKDLERMLKEAKNERNT